MMWFYTISYQYNVISLLNICWQTGACSRAEVGETMSGIFYTLVAS